jgi:DNA-binding MarR family transcriptional regulator
VTADHTHRRDNGRPAGRPAVPLPEALASDVGFLLARSAARATRAANTELEAHGLKARQYALLRTCAGGGAPQRRIATTLGLDPSIVVAMVDELESRGLVERCLDPDDRRSKLVTLTARGRALGKKAAAAIAAAEDLVLSGLTDPERAEFTRLLRRVLGVG